MSVELAHLGPLQADWLRVLAAYALAERERRSTSAASPQEGATSSSTDEPAEASDEAAERESHFIPRLLTINDVPPSDLSPIHGRLVALDLLKFELAGRDCQLAYRLTPLGRQALAAAG